MNYQAFTAETLLLMHHAVRGALAVDDELSELGQEERFRVRETTEWMTHAAELEAEMHRRGVRFDPIRWSTGAVSDEELAEATAPAGRDATASPGGTPEGAAPARKAALAWNLLPLPRIGGWRKKEIVQCPEDSH